jgi:hypothetical protein
MLNSKRDASNNKQISPLSPDNLLDQTEATTKYPLQCDRTPLSTVALNQHSGVTKVKQMVLSQISHTRPRFDSRSIYGNSSRLLHRDILVSHRFERLTISTSLMICEHVISGVGYLTEEKSCVFTETSGMAILFPSYAENSI